MFVLVSPVTHWVSGWRKYLLTRKADQPSLWHASDHLNGFADLQATYKGE